ncbi:hypothetical protein HOD19_02670 [bacterium]|jgi:hypothetical protein|nr:hypothetical protein [bacterium]MBT4649083.1 hypothetical protein [bacterium]
MQIGEHTLDLTNPLSQELLEQYRCHFRWKLIHHESLVSDLHMAVYFKSASDLQGIPVCLTTNEIANLLLLEVLIFLDSCDCRDRMGVKDNLPSFIRNWWSNNQTRFCRAFFPLLGPHQGDAERCITAMLVHGPEIQHVTVS